MPTCFSPGCKSGYNSDRQEKKRNGEKMQSFFKPPRDPVMFALWQKAIPRADRKLSPKDWMCGIHFREEDIQRTFEQFTLFDGTLWCEKKDHPSLKRGAIPCYFPNVPGYSNCPTKKMVDKKKNLSKKKKRKDQKRAKINEFIENRSEEKTGLSGETTVQIPHSVLRDNLSIAPQNNDKENLSIHSQVNPMDALTQAAEVIFSQENYGDFQEIVTDPGLGDNSVHEPEVVLPQSVLDEQFSFQFIKTNINMIDKQNSMWIMNVLDTFIVCARWNSDYVVERKIVIKDDLTVKVFLKERLTTIGNDLKLVSLETISKLIYRVEKAIICPEICNNEGKCHGFLQGTFMCKKTNLCEGCIKWEKEKVLLEKRRLLEEKRIAQKQVELIKFHFTV